MNEKILYVIKESKHQLLEARKALHLKSLDRPMRKSI
jgi:hypothetical protein